eukprot:TRINITY_DN32127_c0_g1_i1.p1 TRINITY_DN32127_c0_g1~~TRINITY_DN32127_c0_g1_i1.p1  ORF type:complete len:192 (+),score=35.03 TRINITY_DN32127_c0_g1_i1:595-1170(+)
MTVKPMMSFTVIHVYLETPIIFTGTSLIYGVQYENYENDATLWEAYGQLLINKGIDFDWETILDKRNSLCLQSTQSHKIMLFKHTISDDSSSTHVSWGATQVAGIVTSPVLFDSKPQPSDSQTLCNLPANSEFTMLTPLILLFKGNDIFCQVDSPDTQSSHISHNLTLPDILAPSYAGIDIQFSQQSPIFH